MESSGLFGGRLRIMCRLLVGRSSASGSGGWREGGGMGGGRWGTGNGEWEKGIILFLFDHCDIMVSIIDSLGLFFCHLISALHFFFPDIILSYRP